MLCGQIVVVHYTFRLAVVDMDGEPAAVTVEQKLTKRLISNARNRIFIVLGGLRLVRMLMRTNNNHGDCDIGTGTG